MADATLEPVFQRAVNQTAEVMWGPTLRKTTSATLVSNAKTPRLGAFGVRNFPEKGSNLGMFSSRSNTEMLSNLMA